MSSELKPSTVAEIRQMADMAVVMAFAGTVVKRFKRNAGENSQGPWSIENIEVKDAAGEVIKVKIKDRDQLDASFAAGARILISSTKSDKHGWIGCKAKDDDYKEKVTRILWVTSSATIEMAPPAAQNAATAKSGPSTQRQAEPSSGDPVGDAITLICKLDNLERLCLRATHRLADDFKAAFGRPMDDALFQSINSSYFIRCKDQGVYMDFPTKPIPMTKGSK